MFHHDRTVYADLSMDLGDKPDWNVGALREFEYPTGISTIAVEPISGLLAIGTTTGAIHIFGGVSVETKLALPEPVKVKFLQFSSSTFQLAFIALESGEIRTYDLLCLRKSSYRIPNMWALFEEKTVASRADKPPPTSQIPVETVVHPRDLNLLFVAYSDTTQYASLRTEFDILTHRRPDVTAIAIHPAGHFLAVGYSDGCIAFWAIEDEDQPLLVRTLDTVNVNFESRRDVSPLEREPIYKLAWSSFSNSPDPRGGPTALTILGGLVMAQDQAPGLTVQWLPAFNPPEPPATLGPAVALHSFMRSAMQASVVPSSDFFYCTSGIAQDFSLVPRSSPHLGGHYDPLAILILVESMGDTRIVEAYQFPPPVFLASPEPEPEENAGQSESLVDDLASTLKALAVDDDPHTIRLPTPLSFAATGILGAQLYALDQESHGLLVGGEQEDAFTLPLRGGAAWTDESKARELRLAKYQSPRILMSHHRDMAAALQFHDISAQLLIASEKIENHFPKPLPGLTIDLRPVLTDAAVVKKTSPTFVHRAVIQSAHLARQSLECAIILESGELIVYRPRSGSTGHTLSKEIMDEEIILLEHAVSPNNSTFTPYFLLTTGKPVSACAISDIGFLAVAHADSLTVVDMRGPIVILRHGSKKRHSTMLADSVNRITSLTWSIAGLDGDPQLRIRLLVGHDSGTTEIITVVRDGSNWRVDAEIKKVDTVIHPLLDGTFVVDSKSGAICRATKGQLAQSFQSAAPDAHRILVTAGAKGVKSFSDINGARIGKADWGNKSGAVESVQIVEKMRSHALVAFTEKNEVLAYSLPQLEYICTLQLPGNNRPRYLTCDETGDWLMCTLHDALPTIDHASYGTLFDFRRAYTPPDIDFSITKPTVPSQPQPVSLGPTSILSSWFRFGQSMTGEQLDTLLGGPDRPIPQVVPTAGTSKSASTAQAAGGAQSSLYSRLQSAVGERGQMLGDLEDRFNSLEQGSRSMVAQAKRLAAEQSAKSWFGI
ncbi:WD40 containing snare-dependent exocytosis protein [Mycena rebaudengoi]|nr:WD40 containing snare-dependent exocytosis protein [Mycena rebaudengoi]